MTSIAKSILFNTKKKLPVFKQDQLSECGHACVAMISNYHGHQIDLISLRAMEPPSINGSSLLDLIRIFEMRQWESTNHPRVIGQNCLINLSMSSNSYQKLYRCEHPLYESYFRNSKVEFQTTSNCCSVGKRVSEKHQNS